MTRWTWLRSLCLTAAVIAVTSVAPGSASAQDPNKTLRFIAHADLTVLDPLWTTAYISRNFGYMIYDTLFSLDEHFEPKPQMVDTWKVSDDKLTYTFTLRAGLKFHDGAPVRSADCIASLARWMKRDSLGQTLAAYLAEMKAVDDQTFTIALKKPFGLLLGALAKMSSYAPFIVPERLAMTDSNEQIKETIGSGPFKFVREEWAPGSKVVFARNADYVPRQEPPSWLSGGKVVKLDRVEWLYIPDSTTAANALMAGEVDWWEQPPPDYLPLLAKNKDVRVRNIDPMGTMGVVRFNTLLPPFDNKKIRQAFLYALEQTDYLRVLAGDDTSNWKVCYSYFTCGGAMASEAGAEPLKGKRDIEKAKQLLKEAGYKGEKVVILHATDIEIVTKLGLVTDGLLRQMGVNVDLQAMDWGTLLKRRSSKEPIDKGGWNIFNTGFIGADMVDPAVNLPLRANGDSAWFGWFKDDKIEELRNQWFEAPDLAAQKKIAEAIQIEAFDQVPCLPTGQFILPTAFRSNIDGVIITPVIFLWNIEKK